VKTIKKFGRHAATLGLLLFSTSALAQTQHLPISSFLDAQTAGQVTFWSDPVSGGLLAFDTFGKRNAALGLNLFTAIGGDVAIRDLGNGTEQVSVDIHTRDGVCWGFVNANPAFGQTPAAIAAGAVASLGDQNFHADFIQPSGTPLQTWNFIAFGGGPPITLLSVKTSITCQNGQLRAPGSGFPDGTPGSAHTTQTGNLSTGVPAGCPPEKDGDCFPAEKVTFKANGS